LLKIEGGGSSLLVISRVVTKPEARASQKEPP